MQKITLTIDFVKKLSAECSKKVVIYDEKVKYLAVRTTVNGNCSYYYIRKIAGKVNYVKIGDTKSIFLDDARKIAAGYSLRIAAGLSIYEDDQEQPTQDQEMTIGYCVDKYLAARLARRGESRSLSISRRRLEMYLPDQLRHKLVDEVRRSDVESLMFCVADKSGKRNASLLIIDLRAAINYMIDNDYPIAKNPASGVKLFPTVERSRFLLPAEMSLFFSKLDESESMDFRDLVRLLIFTGKRKNNICGLRWSWVNIEMGCIVIPGADTKNKCEDVTVLDEFALDVLMRRRSEQLARGRLPVYVFPSDRSRCGYYSEPSHAWADLIARSGLQDLRIHDLRRTLASWMANRNVSYEMIANILGQSSTGATHIYARFALDPKRAAVSGAVSEIALAGGLRFDPDRYARDRVIKLMDNDPKLAAKIIDFLGQPAEKMA